MKLSVNYLHHQGNDWLRELKFYKDELFIMRDRLAEVVVKNTAREILSVAEHFQNKFIVIDEQCDILRHAVNARTEKVNNLAKGEPTHVGHKTIADGDGMEQRMQDFSSNFQSTRLEFNKFLSKVF